MKTDKRFLKALDYVLAFEGGKVDDEQDRGVKLILVLLKLHFQSGLLKTILKISQSLKSLVKRLRLSTQSIGMNLMPQ